MVQAKTLIMIDFGIGLKKMSEKNIVLVSEHKAPSEWDCILEQEVKRTIDNNKRVKAVEKLFEIRE